MKGGKGLVALAKLLVLLAGVNWISVGLLSKNLVDEYVPYQYSLAKTALYVAMGVGCLIVIAKA